MPKAKAAGVAAQIRFRKLDAAHGLPEQLDVITTFDVICDSADPCGLSESTVRALCAQAGFGSMRRLPLERPFEGVA